MVYKVYKPGRSGTIGESRPTMKFTVPVSCSACGCDFRALGYGQLTFPPATCKCGAAIRVYDPLSISVVGERLLHRSQAELDGGDFTMAIICGAMAVESALTSVYVKWRELNHGYGTASVADREAWVRDYITGTKRGGFANSANFVSNYLAGKPFDSFVDDLAARSGMSLAVPAIKMKTAHIRAELFTRRNQIMHWGNVGYTKQEAQKAYVAALAAFAVLRVMDKDKADASDWKMRAELWAAPLTWVRSSGPLKK